MYWIWQQKKFSLKFVFFRTFQGEASPLNLESNWQLSYYNALSCLSDKKLFWYLEALIKSVFLYDKK